MKGLLEALRTAKPEDLAELDTEIVAKRKDLESMQALRKVLNVAMNGKPVRQAGTGNGQAGGRVSVDQHRTNVLKYLDHGGLTKRSVLMEACKISSAMIEKVLNHPWFRKTDQGIQLTQAGKDEVG